MVKNGNARKTGFDSQRSTATMTASAGAGANQASLATLSRNNTLTSCEDVSSNTLCSLSTQSCVGFVVAFGFIFGLIFGLSSFGQIRPCSAPPVRLLARF